MRLSTVFVSSALVLAGMSTAFAVERENMLVARFADFDFLTPVERRAYNEELELSARGLSRRSYYVPYDDGLVARGNGGSGLRRRELARRQNLDRRADNHNRLPPIFKVPSESNPPNHSYLQNIYGVGHHHDSNRESQSHEEAHPIQGTHEPSPKPERRIIERSW